MSATEAGASFGESLEAWLNFLDSAGFRLGIREQLHVRVMYAKLAASGELPENRPLEKILELAAPLLCTQPEQQEKYTHLLKKFIPKQQISLDITTQSLDESTIRGPRQWRMWHTILAALLGGILTLFWIYQIQLGHPTVPLAHIEVTPPSTPQTYAPDLSPPTDNKVKPVPPPWLIPVRIGLLIFASLSFLGLACIAWARLRRQLYLYRTKTKNEVTEHQLTDPDLVNIEPPAAFARRVARTLLQRYTAERKVLDVLATLRATIKAVGAISPCYTKLKGTPEYLALIDVKHPYDHHTAYSESLITAMKRQGVEIEVRYFEGSPRLGCWRMKQDMSHDNPIEPHYIPSRHTSFAELAALFAGHRLLVFSETQALENQPSGKPFKWVDHLKAFPQRAWLTPMPLASWGRLEQIADAQGFLVLPMQPESLDTLAGWFSAGHLGLEIGSEWPLNYPPILRNEAIAWVTRPFPPPSEAHDDLLFQLRDYLGAQRFQWLCACAILPAITPSVTLALSRELDSDSRKLALGMAAIGALPWFRYGYMPDWLRESLINQLNKFNESRFRKIIEERLSAAIEGSEPSLLTISESKRRRLLDAWYNRRIGLAQDVVMVGFLDRGTLARLAQKIPEGLRNRLFRGGLPTYGLRNVVIGSFSFIFLSGFLALPGIWEKMVAATLKVNNLPTVSTSVVTPSDQENTARIAQEQQAVRNAKAEKDKAVLLKSRAAVQDKARQERAMAVVAKAEVDAAATLDAANTAVPVKAAAADSNVIPNVPPLKRIIHYPTDVDSVSESGKSIVFAHAKYLMADEKRIVWLEGNTDERGSSEYNTAIAQRLSDGVKKLLLRIGVKESQINSISCGEESPADTAHNNTAWSKNRRVEFIYDEDGMALCRFSRLKNLNYRK